MKSIHKRIICLILTLLILLTFTLPCFAVSDNIVSHSQDGYITLSKDSKINSEIEEVNEAKLIVAEMTNICDDDKEAIKEITDNGTDIFIKCKPTDQISKKNQQRQRN